MGQKTNPVILRQNLTNLRQSNEFFEKNHEESSLYVFKDNEIKNYLNNILFKNGLILCDCKISYEVHKISIFLSFYVSLLFLRNTKLHRLKILKKKNFPTDLIIQKNIKKKIQRSEKKRKLF